MATATSGYTLLDDFVPEILQYCHGAPTILVRNALISTMIEFCKRTLCLKVNPSSFYIEEDIHTYTLKYASDRYVVIDIEEMIEGEDAAHPALSNTTQHTIEGSTADWRSATSADPTHYWLTDDVNKVRVWPTPTEDSDDEFFVSSIVCPRKDQTEVDELLYVKWEEVIQAGALARLLLMPGASWNAPKLASKMAIEYKRGIRDARKTTLTGTGQVPTQVTPRSFIVLGASST